MTDPANLVSRMRALIAAEGESDLAHIRNSTDQNPQEARVLTLALDTAQLASQPFAVGFPFRSFLVLDATDSSVTVNVRLGSQDSFQDAFAIYKGGQLALPSPISRAYLDWSAQSGKTITILFLVSGTFSANILNLVNSGSVTIGDGTIVAAQSPVTTVTSGAAVQLFAADSSRKKMMIVNYSGATVYIGDSAVTIDSGAKPGIPILPGGSYAWESTAACYAAANAAATPIGLVKFS